MTRHARRLGGLCASLVVLVLAGADPVAAHSLGGQYFSPLPLTAYVAGAALAVGLSFAFVMLRDVRAPPVPLQRTLAVPLALRVFLRGLGLLMLLWIAAQALLGGSSDADVASLFLWTYIWVGVAIVSALVGPVWRWLDPFSTLYDIGAALVRRAGVRQGSPAPYPARVGAWPAVIGFLALVWTELVLQLGGGPLLGRAILGYAVLTLALMAYFGKETWRDHGEIFGVWFGTLNRIAPMARDPDDDARVVVRPFASGLLSPGWTLDRVVLVVLAAGAILYDGLAQTRLWFDLFGLPGLPEGTVLLLGSLALLLGVVLALTRSISVPALGAGILPIAVGYLVSHYVTLLLYDGQRILIALSDPFQQGWDLFGTAFTEPNADLVPAWLIWTIQLGAVVGGHVVGAWAGHAAVSATEARPRRVTQLPLAALMVVLTATTLWTLGQAIVVDPGGGEATAAVPAGVTPVDGAARDPG